MVLDIQHSEELTSVNIIETSSHYKVEVGQNGIASFNKQDPDAELKATWYAAGYQGACDKIIPQSE